LDTVVAPAWVLFGESKREIYDNLPHARPTRFLLSAKRVIPFLSHPLSMPAKDRIGREDCPDLQEEFPAQELTFDSQSAPLVVIEENPLLTEFLPQDLILGTEVVDHHLLLPIDPAGQDEEIELPGIKDLHRCSGYKVWGVRTASGKHLLKSIGRDHGMQERAS
jgi:hypothetical protein